MGGFSKETVLGYFHKFEFRDGFIKHKGVFPGYLYPCSASKFRKNTFFTFFASAPKIDEISASADKRIHGEYNNVGLHFARNNLRELALICQLAVTHLRILLDKPKKNQKILLLGHKSRIRAFLFKQSPPAQ